MAIAGGLSPRVRGNLVAVSVDGRRQGLGLSPRVRGNRRGSKGIPLWRRSIPARTGEPPPRCERGEGGSIPARTGEPQCPRSTANGRTVYPRAYGGTSPHAIITWKIINYGLSPRVRGNPINNGPSETPPSGSIPARTGEPIRRRDRQDAQVARTGEPKRVRSACRVSIPARTGEPRHCQVQAPATPRVSQ